MESQSISRAAIEEPHPKQGQLEVYPYVLKDIQERVDLGYTRYGCHLETFNGRDALWDAYQEAIDLVMYLRQSILERDSHNGQR